MNFNSKGNLKLKLVTISKLCLTKFLLINEEYSENKCLSITLDNLHIH